MRKISEILCCVAILCCALSACSDKPATVKVSSFNIWLNTLGGKLLPSQTAKVIEASQTDIVGIQEGHIYEEDGIKHDHVPEIAESLGFHLFNQGEGHYILSRYPVVDSTASRYGVKIQVGKDKFCWMFNCHLYYIPYQPYQLNGIPYGDYPFIDTEEEAVRFANEARREEVTRYQVEWPATKAFSEIGMNDSYRTIHPDEVSTPGYTWTPVPSEQEILDRLDFVLYSGCKVTDSFITGESEATSDVVVSPYPSDHRMVTSCFNF